MSSVIFGLLYALSREKLFMSWSKESRLTLHKILVVVKEIQKRLHILVIKYIETHTLLTVLFFFFIWKHYLSRRFVRMTVRDPFIFSFNVFHQSRINGLMTWVYKYVQICNFSTKHRRVLIFFYPMSMFFYFV